MPASVQLPAALGHGVEERRCLAVQKFDVGRDRAAGRGMAGDGAGLIVIIFTPGMFLPASIGSNSGLSRSLVPVRISVLALIEASAFAVSPPKPGVVPTSCRS